MKRIFLGIALSFLLVAHSTYAGLFDFLKSSASSTNSALGSLTSLSQDQVVNGLKEALAKGVEHAVSYLGRTNGFMTNMTVHITVPQKLQTAEKGLRALGQGQLVDDFVASMNHAAEQAVPVAASVVGDSIKGMSIADAKSVVTSTNDAATQYFRRTTQTNLYAKFLPIVQKATDSVGVTAKYKSMMSKFTQPDSWTGILASKTSINLSSADIDSYVTTKAMDGLFAMIAEEEKSIRANPAARTTDLLQKVFGAGK